MASNEKWAKSFVMSQIPTIVLFSSYGVSEKIFPILKKQEAKANEQKAH